MYVGANLKRRGAENAEEVLYQRHSASSVTLCFNLPLDPKSLELRAFQHLLLAILISPALRRLLSSNG